MKKLQTLGYMALGSAITLILAFAVPAIAASVEKQLTVYYNDIKIYVDGELITPKDPNGNIVDPFVSEGTTYLPVRAVAEALGKTVDWDGATQSVYIGAKPGAVQYMTDILPAYQSENPTRYREYSAYKSGNTETFNMGGVKYLNGFTLMSDGFYDAVGDGGVLVNNWAVWNLNGQYSSMSAVLCHIDGTSVGTGVVEIYYDGVLSERIDVAPDMAPKTLNLSLNGVNQLKIMWGAYQSGTTYGIGNPILR